MIHKLILCLVLIAGQITGQSICCCQHHDLESGPHEHVHVGHDHSHHGHSHGNHSHSHGPVSVTCCDGDHLPHHCDCDSRNLVFVAGQFDPQSERDRIDLIADLPDDFLATRRNLLVHGEASAIPDERPGSTLRASLGIWLL